MLQAPAVIQIIRTALTAPTAVMQEIMQMPDREIRVLTAAMQKILQMQMKRTVRMIQRTARIQKMKIPQMLIL